MQPQDEGRSRPSRGSIRLAAVFAHPDDDVYQLGGSLILHRGELDVTLVFATSGGAGPISGPGLATRETLAEVRELEQRACLQRIGVNARVEFLRYPDYYLPGVPFGELVGRIESILRDVRPHLVVTFGPEGITSHHDHVRAGEAATEAFHRARPDAADGEFARLYRTALRRSRIDAFYRAVEENGWDFGREGELFNPTAVPDELVDVVVDTRPVAHQKLAGILEHRTQLSELERIPEPLRGIYIDEEAFVEAWPGRTRAPGEVRRDLLEDLRITCHVTRTFEGE